MAGQAPRQLERGLARARQEGQWLTIALPARGVGGGAVLWLDRRAGRLDRLKTVAAAVYPAATAQQMVADQLRRRRAAAGGRAVGPSGTPGDAGGQAGRTLGSGIRVAPHDAGAPGPPGRTVGTPAGSPRFRATG